MKKILLMAVLAAVTFTSCNKEDNTGNTGDGKNEEVTLLFQQPGALESRAETSPVVGNVTVALNGGYIYFANGTTVTKVVQIVASGGDNDATVDIPTLTTAPGATIKNVPSGSTQVIIYSNLPSSVTPTFAKGDAVKGVEELAITLAQLYTATPNGGVSAVPLHGQALIDKNVTPNRADVDVYPIGSRLEISKLSLKSGSKIDSYKVEGIFINNYYTSQYISGGNATAATPVNHQDDATKYADAGTTGSGYIGYTFLYDILNQADASGEIAPATAGNVWAYNVFPAKNVASEDNLPHIIVVFTDVVLDGTPIATKRYLTIADYKLKGGSSISEFKKSVVYRLTDLAFDENDLDILPENKLVDMIVEAEVIQWTGEEIEWNN